MLVPVSDVLLDVPDQRADLRVRRGATTPVGQFKNSSSQRY
jgi:hypothetical protein